jgi:membrane protease YdiL (CAAX protease family)
VFQNSQAGDVRQKKHANEGRIQRRQSMVTGLNNSKAKSRDSVESSWTEHLVEVSVFLFLIVPSMILSFFAVKQGILSFGFVAIATILRDLGLVSLILFFVWRNGESVNFIGWTFKNARREFGLGIGLYIPFFLATGLFERALRMVGFSVPSTPLPSFTSPTGMGDFLLGLVLVAVVALAEETIFRGYLILRLKAITARPAMAVLLSAALFSLGHGYEGSAGVITVGVMGLVLAFVYIWRQSLVAPIVMHFLQDFISIVLLPLLGKG